MSALLLAHYVGKPDSEIANGRVDSQENGVTVTKLKTNITVRYFKNNEALAQNYLISVVSIGSQQLNKVKTKVTTIGWTRF